jgi:hypothetical protein
MKAMEGNPLSDFLNEHQMSASAAVSSTLLRS